MPSWSLWKSSFWCCVNHLLKKIIQEHSWEDILLSVQDLSFFTQNPRMNICTLLYKEKLSTIHWTLGVYNDITKVSLPKWTVGIYFIFAMKSLFICVKKIPLQRLNCLIFLLDLCRKSNEFIIDSLLEVFFGLCTIKQ